MMNLSKVNKKNKHIKMSRRIGRSLVTGACSAILFTGMAAVPAMAEAVDPAEAVAAPARHKAAHKGNKIFFLIINSP